MLIVDDRGRFELEVPRNGYRQVGETFLEEIHELVAAVVAGHVEADYDDRVGWERMQIQTSSGEPVVYESGWGRRLWARWRRHGDSVAHVHRDYAPYCE